MVPKVHVAIQALLNILKTHIKRCEMLPLKLNSLFTHPISFLNGSLPTYPFVIMLMVVIVPSKKRKGTIIAMLMKWHPQAKLQKTTETISLHRQALPKKNLN